MITLVLVGSPFCSLTPMMMLAIISNISKDMMKAIEI